MLLAYACASLIEALLVRERLVGIALRRNHRIGHLHVDEVDGGDGDAGVVVIERASG